MGVTKLQGTISPEGKVFMSSRPTLCCVAYSVFPREGLPFGDFVHEFSRM